MIPNSIIIHHSLTRDSRTVSWHAIRRYHIENLGWRNIGYHFGIELVGNDYEAFVGRMLNEAGAHCRESQMNQKSIGICMVGNFDKNPPAKGQYELLIRLVRALCETLKIRKDRIWAHREFAKYKTCPGEYFDIDEFRHFI